MRHNLAPKFFFVLLTVFFIGLQDIYSRESEEKCVIDSILNLIASQNDDVEKARLYNEIVHIPDASYDTRIKYALLSLELCSPKNLELIADNYNFLAYSYIQLGNPQKSLEYDRPLLEFYKKMKKQERVAVVYSRMATDFEYMNQIDSVFHYRNKALQTYENLNDTVEIANSYFEIGATNNNLSFYKTAEDYYRKALAMDSSIGNRLGMARDYCGIGMSISEMMATEDPQKLKLSLVYLKKSADGFENTAIDGNDLQNVLYKYMSYLYLSYSYIRRAETEDRTCADSCRIYLDKIGSFFDDIGYTFMAWQQQHTVVRYLTFNQKYDEALEIMLGLEKRLKNGELDHQASNFYSELADLYMKKGDYHNACVALRNYYEDRLTLINDSALTSAANAQTEQALMYERRITNAEKRHMRIVNVSLIGGLILISLLVIIIIRMLHIKHKANAELRKNNAILSEQKEKILAQRDEIEKQRDEIMAQRNHIEQQNKQIQSSINYAQRIQSALLTPEETIDSIFPDHFVLYKPCEIVGGDFYWVRQFGDYKVCIVADCSGHGVPGGFMSVLGMTNLNYIVGQELTPDAILNKLREAIMLSLRQKEVSFEELTAQVLDGMDVAAYVVNERQMTLSFAGANNPLLLIRDNEAKLIKADRMPVSISIGMKPFKSVTMELRKGDCLYTYSDGFPDQFNHETEKKFQKGRLIDLLIEIHDRPMIEQRALLNVIFEEWRGPAENQTDDVVIMGVKI